MNGRKTLFLTFLFRGLSAILTFATSAITARYLIFTGDRGDFQTSTTYATSGQRFAGGYSNYFSMSLPRRPDEGTQIVQMGNFMMFLFSIVVWLIAGAVIWFGHPSTIVMFSLIGMPLTFLFGYASRLLNALHAIFELNIANVLQAVSFLVIYVVFILFNRHLGEHHRLLWTYRIWLASWALAVMATMFAVYRHLNWGESLKWKWHRSEWKQFVNFGTWSSLALLLGYVNLRTDFWMIGWVLPYDDATRRMVSVYGIAVSAAEILITLSQSIGTVVFRKMSASSGDEAGMVTESASRQTLITSFVTACGLAVAMPLLVVVYGVHKYGGAVGPFYVLLPGLILKTVSTLISQYFTNSKGKPVTLVVISIFMIAFNAAVCAVLIPRFGMYGASISSTAAYFVELATYIYWYSRISGRSGRNLWLVQKGDFRPYIEMASGLVKRVKRGA
ncbi:polysaccharide biosynthesis C-terminal domain-containing protein [Alicyclobacillus fastidiosus]|uniref:Polysaccharide biosynthesis C-terminal domain-containing protein n=1 Tax=Alicyclobacillus fastidiosus TaxID=392011 RepID=A0ABV5AHK0_9BACL|nr:polysaccharide biosynthesis C-terminal domain-containing protein [Alicyclobacillus fastidiosus]WEH09142.1 polysaccharide biosynthesis C-terminal domain-containing protein [Alicyclobacillus fastidiosus]